MAKKQDTFYFDTFTSCAEHAEEASRILRKCIDNYDPDNLSGSLDEIHKVEHDADMKKHELINVLAKAFITPIEREDIMLMSQCLDEVVDKLEDVFVKRETASVEGAFREGVRVAILLALDLFPPSGTALRSTLPTVLLP